MNTKLYRSRTNYKLGGVCGGLGEYFNIDVTVIRLITLMFVIWGGGFIFYLAAWIILPEGSSDYRHLDSNLKSANPSNRHFIIGWALVFIASSMIFRRYLPYIPFKQYIWPAMLLFAGYHFITKSKSKNY